MHADEESEDIINSPTKTLNQKILERFSSNLAPQKYITVVLKHNMNRKSDFNTDTRSLPIFSN